MRRGVINKFNRGELDPRALVRDDVEKINNSSELMLNFLPQRLGSMQYRSGTRHLGTIPTEARILPFIAATNDTAILEFTTTGMRVWVDDELVTRPASNLTITNGEFATDFAGWTDASGVGSAVNWTSFLGGAVNLSGSTTTSAKLWQTFGDVGAYAGVEHGITIVIGRAPVLVKIGESGVDSDDIFTGTLQPGTHSFSVTPVAAHPTITLSNSTLYAATVGEVTVEAAGVMSLPLPVSIDDIDSMRPVQSADVEFIATDNTPQFMVARRGVKSWGVTTYRVDNGPFGLINNTEVTLTAGALSGDTTLTASSSKFNADSVGNIYKLASTGQVVSAAVSAANTGTNSIRVNGVAATRQFTISITGTWVGTITLQRSTDDATWSDVEPYSSNVSKNYNDTLDNSILYYRLFCKTGDYTSGTANLVLSYSAGTIDGTCRVVSYTSATVVNVQVLTPFGDTDATRDWYEGEWSTKKGFPTAVSIYEGRLWWGGKRKLWGSVSDEYQSFDSDLEGNSAMIRRTIGFGPVDTVAWLAPSSRLIMGVASDEISVRSSSFGEVLSPTNTNLKSGSTQGVASIDPVKVDDSIIYVQRSGVKLMESFYSVDQDGHQSADLNALHPTICSAGIKRIAVARQPETRVFCVLDDGTVRIHLRDPAEDVAAWSRWETSGTVEDLIVLPGLREDIVYAIITRSGVRCLERLSFMEDMVAEHFDSATLYTSPGTTLTGLDRHNGKTVGVWADGQDRGTATVAGGQITVAASWTNVTVGLPYTATYKSNKISRYVKQSVIGRTKRIVDINLVMSNFWPGALTLGPSFTQLEIMPETEWGAVLDTTTLVEDYDEYPFEFNGEEENDPRICIEATAPCIIHALTYGVLQDGDTGGDPGGSE